MPASPAVVLAPEPTPVADLVRAARRGDAAATEELIRRHLRAAYAVALAVLGRPADADDIAQDAFLVAIERLDECRDPARFSGWLVQIVRNRALHAVEKRRLRDPIDEEGEIVAHVPASDVVLRGRLLAALSTLTPVQREIVLLHDLDGWTHAEIADALGMTETNCRQHLFTARKALRARLEAADGT
ncbi:MAG TPA: sigma-70 family RNA polymerase sigma factor [Kofleriaceae bacterium]|nr:sigma-70 family RNA polymerase sigma factor [Kofleriaceae bacterium]